MSTPNTNAPGAPTGAPLLSGKVWATLRARAALQGLVLARTDVADGPVRLLVCRRGAWREIGSIEQLEDLVVTAAGARP